MAGRIGTAAAIKALAPCLGEQEVGSPKEVEHGTEIGHLKRSNHTFALPSIPA